MTGSERPEAATPTSLDPPALVPRGAVGAAERAALERGAALARPARQAHFRLTGGGRLACLQGLVTCDVERPGDGTLSFGALLTAKGMIVAPLWVARLEDQLVVSAPAEAAAAVAAVFERSLPPRLCRWEEAALASVGVYGPAAANVAAKLLAGALPDAPGRVTPLLCDGAPAIAAHVAARGVEGLDCVIPADAAPAFLERATRAGAVRVPEALLEERRILSGFPRLGAEIDDKTLPQEVRLDLLGAVSYTKGCYVGQETVARVHFRGHANRHLVGVELADLPPALPAELFQGERPIGRVTSACWWDARAGHVGLAVVRREVEAGASAHTAEGAPVTVRALPWEAPPGSA